MLQTFRSDGKMVGLPFRGDITTWHTSDSYEVRVFNKQYNMLHTYTLAREAVLTNDAVINFAKLIIKDLSRKTRISSLEINETGQLDTLRAILQSVYPSR